MVEKYEWSMIDCDFDLHIFIICQYLKCVENQLEEGYKIIFHEKL